MNGSPFRNGVLLTVDFCRKSLKWYVNTLYSGGFTHTFSYNKYGTVRNVREPVIGLIKWLRPKGLKVCSYVEMCAEFKRNIP